LNTRFRDVSQIVDTVLQIAIFATPIMWTASALNQYELVAELNPLYHWIELVRAPLLGEAPSASSWTTSIAMLLVGALLAMLLLRRTERRIVYWV
jgi:lipopolysaccharide transport system permease protein